MKKICSSDSRTAGLSSKVFAILVLILMITFPKAAFGQTAFGPRYPGTGTNVDGPGTESWTNPGNIAADDVDSASVWLPNTETTTFTSEYLEGRNYGFSIPAGATINGIQVRVMRQSSDYNPDGVGIYDASLNLLKGGIIAGENRASAAIWSEDMTEVLYGGVSDLWGTTWSAEDINNSNFGASFSVTQNGTGDRTAYVDYISITVTFTAPPPTVLPGFPGTGANADGPGTESWINPEYITADDVNYASVILPNTETSTFTSEYLRGTNYGFAIPTGATISGIQVKIMRQSSDYNPDGVGIYDAALNLLKAGSIAGNNHANAGIWQEDMTEVTYGGEYDLWGTTWTAEEINNTNFGVSFSVTQNGTGDREAYVDYISVTVYFTVTPPAVTPGLPGTGANVDGPGTEPWINPEYITADDDNYANVTLPNTEIASFTSEYLRGTNYGFAIPTGATINGIQVKIMRQSSDYNPDGIGIYDVSLNLLKTGIIAGNNLAKAEIWSEDFTEVTYGGEYELWGTTWTAEEINNTNFGVSFSVTQNGEGGRIAYVDYISITVFYTSLPSLTVNPASLNFGSVLTGENSPEQIFQLSGLNFTQYSGNITITAPSADFQVSNDNNIWGAVTSVTYDSYNLPATDVYVRFSPQTSGLKSGNISLGGGGVTSPPFVALTGTGAAPAASGDYRSASTTGGIWSNPATWEYFNGTSWVTATKSPESTDNNITILSSNTVYVDIAVTVDQVVVENGGQLIATADVNIVNGPGDDFTVYGIFARVGGNINNSGGTLVFGDGGTYQHAMNGSSIPAATWGTGSNCNINGMTYIAPTGLDQNFGNFTWECSSQVLPANLNSNMTVAGNFTVRSTGGSDNVNRILRMSNGSNNYTIDVSGNFNVISPATFKMNSSSGSCTLNIGGNLNIEGSATGTTGFYLNSFNGTASAIVNLTGNLNVLSGYLIFSNSGGGAGALATLNLSGDFNHSGGYVQNTSTGAGYIGNINFTGDTIQTFNSVGITANHIINLNVNEGAYLQMGTPGTTVTGSGTFILSDGTTLGITSSAGITASGASGNIQTTGTRTFSSAANYIYNGTGAQNTGDGLPSTVNNLGFSNGNIVTLNSARTVTNTFSVNSGTKANLGTFTHETAILVLGGAGQPLGSYGHSSSAATYKNDLFFDAATGIVNNSSPAGTWLGLTSDWNIASNWSGGIPTSGTNAIISSYAAYQPVISGSTTAVSNSVTLNPGASLTIAPSGRAVVNSIINNGTLNLQSSSGAISSLILDSYTDNGTENIQLHLTGGEAGSGNFRWHYISVPIISPYVNLYNGVIPGFNEVTFDLARFEEGAYSGSETNDYSGWIAYDGYRYSDGATVGGFNVLELGKGYDYWDNADQLFTFGGTINTGEITIPLSYSGSTPGSEAFGFNLLGNPFTCGINWDIISGSANYPANTSKALFFTKDNVQYTYIAGVGVPESNASAGIPPMQGFFVKTYSTGNSLSIPLDSRENNSTPRYKGDGNTIPLIRLAVSENDKSDETVIRFAEFAKSGIDYDFDAVKMSGTNNIPSVASLNSSVIMTVNGLPFPESFTEIPLVLRIGETTNGNHTIKTTQLQGLDSYNVSLTDKTGNITVNLKTNPNYTFTASEGLVANRFVLKVAKIATGIEETDVTEAPFSIYTAFGLINILPLSDEWEGLKGSVRISGITGKMVKVNSNQVFSKGSIIQIPAPESQGVYIVELRSGMKRFIGKVVVK